MIKKYLIAFKFTLMLLIIISLSKSNFLIANWSIGFLLFINSVAIILGILVLSCLLGEFGPKICVDTAQMHKNASTKLAFIDTIEIFMCFCLFNFQPPEEEKLFFSYLGCAYLGIVLLSNILHTVILSEIKKILALHSLCQTSILDIKEKIENATSVAEQK